MDKGPRKESKDENEDNTEREYFLKNESENNKF